MDAYSSHNPPPSKHGGIMRPSLATGAHTDNHRRCRTDNGHRTIPTGAIFRISPTLDLPLCALLMPHRTHGHMRISSAPSPPSNNSGIGALPGAPGSRRPLLTWVSGVLQVGGRVTAASHEGTEQPSRMMCDIWEHSGLDRPPTTWPASRDRHPVPCQPHAKPVP